MAEDHKPRRGLIPARAPAMLRPCPTRRCCSPRADGRRPSPRCGSCVRQDVTCRSIARCARVTRFSSSPGRRRSRPRSRCSRSSGSVASPDDDPRRCHRRVPERADRRRRRRRAALRLVGRRPVARRLSRVRPAAYARGDLGPHARHAGDPFRHRDRRAAVADARGGRRRDRPRLARGPRRGLARCRRGRRRAGQPRPRRPAVPARGLRARGAKHPAPGGRPAGPHLQPRPRRAPVHAGRAREGARGDGPRALLAGSPTFGRTSPSAIDSVLLIAFGGPTAPAEIRPFLANVGRGRNIPRERLEEVARHYEAMPGGRSPLNALTEAQAAGLRAALVRGGRPLPVYVGMRNWHPFLHETLAAMAADGRRRAVGLILSAFRSEASWERYAADVAAARARVAGAPEVVYAPPWFEHEHFIAAAADRAAAALGEIPPQARERTPLVFTAHSIPRAMAATSPYVADFGAAAAAVARRLRHARWLLAYQSRSGGSAAPS